MSTNLVLEHGDTIMYKNTSGSTIVTGRMIAIADKMIGVAKADIANNAEGPVFQRGVFKYARLSGGSTAWAIGDPLFYDKDNNRLTKTPGLNDVPAGIAHRVTVDGDTEGEVVLNQKAVGAAVANAGATYVQAEINAILDSLRNAGIIQKGT